MTPTPATAERLARALAEMTTLCRLPGFHIERQRRMLPALDEARAALAAYTAEGGKL